MLIAAATMAGLLGWTFDDGPAELVARLGSPRFADREAAADALRRLGLPAIPALREAQSGRDLEIRIRALELRDEIEASAILKPTMVRLDFKDRPLAEVIDEFGRRVGVSVEPSDQSWRYRQPQVRPPWPDRRISVEAPDPLPFWEATDRLCRVGGLRRPYAETASSPEVAFGRLLLAPGTATPPRSDFGPFRVELLRICRERDIDLVPGRYTTYRFFNPNFSRFGRPGFGPDMNELRSATFFAELLLSVEPRLRIVGSASFERLKATDAQGRSVLPDPTAEEVQGKAEMLRMNPHLDPGLHPELRFGSGYSTSSPTQLTQMMLAVSTPPGARLAELKGVVAVAVMARRPDPIVLPLADAREKSVARDGVHLTIHEADVKPNYIYGELELTLETDWPAETLKVQGPGVAPLAIRRANDLLQQEVEILDDQGQTVDWSFLRPPNPPGVRGRMRLQVRPRKQAERLDFSNLKIRVFSMSAAATEFPFSFTDVPMP